jgi:hypothetical protein
LNFHLGNVRLIMPERLEFPCSFYN